jgi:hypothetical protein
MQTDYRTIPLNAKADDPIPFEPRDYARQREYLCGLERERTNLWGVNEELRAKIRSLERGSLDLQGIIAAIQSSEIMCSSCVATPLDASAIEDTDAKNQMALGL